VRFAARIPPSVQRHPATMFTRAPENGENAPFYFSPKEAGNQTVRRPGGTMTCHRKHDADGRVVSGFENHWARKNWKPDRIFIASIDRKFEERCLKLVGGSKISRSPPKPFPPRPRVSFTFSPFSRRDAPGQKSSWEAARVRSQVRGPKSGEPSGRAWGGPPRRQGTRRSHRAASRKSPF